MRVLLIALLAAISYAQTATIDEEEWIAFNELNQLRQAGFTCGDGTIFEPNSIDLQFDCRLYRAAYLHAKDMADSAFFGHGSLDGRSPFDRGDEQGIYVTGENIAGGTETGMGVRVDFRDSESHCNTMMRSGHLLYAAARYHKPDSTLDWYWVEMFADRIDGFDNSCHETTGEPEPNFTTTTTTTRTPTCPDPMGNYLEYCSKCTHDAQCPLAFTCHQTNKICSHYSLGILYCSNAQNAGCNSDCTESSDDYPTSCQCSDVNFPDNWIECPETTTTKTIILGDWSQWSSWTDCTKSCGSGVSQRTRVCEEGYECTGGVYSTQTDIIDCNEFECTLGDKIPIIHFIVIFASLKL